MNSSLSEQSSLKDFLSQGPCPYLRDRESVVYAFFVKKVKSAVYERIISSGFRRNGFYFYQNLCPNCGRCIPLRVDVQEFRPSGSQRRVLKKNSDISVIRQPAAFDPDGFLLYKKYCARRHENSETKEDYTRFLIESPLHTEMMRYYAGSRLLGIGWIDLLPESLSSVYFAFDPDFSSRSLGVFSLLKELELCRELKKKWLHLGFWIEDNRKMSYKKQYKPCQILTKGIWQRLSG